MRYKCICSYDGKDYKGFQIQKNGNTIQNEIESALNKIVNSNVTIYASGRTDSGVHALGQVFHFDCDLDISEYNMKKALNSYLPNDIHIIEVNKVNEEFHARYSVKKKEYHYIINFGEYNPIEKDYVYQYPYKNINRDLIYQASRLFIGTIDFKSFTKNKEITDTIRTIYSIDFNYIGDKLEIRIIGSGFMHNMVRIIVAMWLEVARGKISLSDLEEVLRKKDRRYAPKVAPACGLYLYRVYY